MIIRLRSQHLRLFIIDYTAALSSHEGSGRVAQSMFVLVAVLPISVVVGMLAWLVDARPSGKAKDATKYVLLVTSAVVAGLFYIIGYGS